MLHDIPVHATHRDRRGLEEHPVGRHPEVEDVHHQAGHRGRQRRDGLAPRRHAIGLPCPGDDEHPRDDTEHPAPRIQEIGQVDAGHALTEWHGHDEVHIRGFEEDEKRDAQVEEDFHGGGIYGTEQRRREQGNRDGGNWEQGTGKPRRREPGNHDSGRARYFPDGVRRLRVRPASSLPVTKVCSRARSIAELVPNRRATKWRWLSSSRSEPLAITR